jgi:hypothetical protein
MNIRRGYWGHWGISFYNRDSETGTITIAAYLPFPGGPCGPVDMPHRQTYTTAILAWVDHGILPASAIFCAS